MEERYTKLGGLHTYLVTGPWEPRMRVVFLHGHDMQASELTPFAHSLAIPGVAYAFPQAPTAVSESGFAWWPGERLKSDRSASEPRDLWQTYPAGRGQARELFRDFLACLHAHSGEPQMLAGFSQGAMLACDAALMADVPIAGLALMSASCIAFDEWEPRRNRLEDLPCFVSHGRNDCDLAFGAGERLRDFLMSAGSRVTWAAFDGGHEIPFPVWRGFKQFIQTLLSAVNEQKTHAYETH